MNIDRIDYAGYIKRIEQNAGNRRKLKEMLKLFGEHYRKAYTAQKHREAYNPERCAEYCRKWRTAHQKEVNEKNRERYRKRAEQEFLEGRRKRKPRHMK
jgi:hypothetical protein